MRAFPLLFNVFFVVKPLVALLTKRFGENADILSDLAHLQEQPSKIGPGTALECEGVLLGGVMYAGDGCIMSRSPRGLEWMMAVFVEVFGALGLAISENRTEIMCMPILHAPLLYGCATWTS